MVKMASSSSSAPTGVAIREAEPTEFESYRELFAACANVRFSNPASGAAYVEEQLRTELASWEATSAAFSAGCSKLWLMTCGCEPRRVIGSVGLVDQGGGNCELVSLFVDEKYRRRGLATALFGTLLVHVRGRGARRISLTTPSDNAAGVALYTRLGFVRSRTWTSSDKLPVELSNFEQQVAATISAA